MRHLKRFNEDADNHQQVFKEELQEFCELNLAYLLDEIAQLQVTDTRNSGSAENDCKITIEINPGKIWDEIKDQMIPFLTRLRNKYQIQEFNGTREKKFDIQVYSYYPYNHISGIKAYDPYVEYEVKNLINDQTTLNKNEIREIWLFISGYKQKKKSILTKIKSYFK